MLCLPSEPTTLSIQTVPREVKVYRMTVLQISGSYRQVPTREKEFDVHVRKCVKSLHNVQMYRVAHNVGKH